MSKNEGDPKFAGSLNHAMIDGLIDFAPRRYTCDACSGRYCIWRSYNVCQLSWFSAV